MSTSTISSHALRLFEYASAHSDWTMRGACDRLGAPADLIEQARDELLRVGLLTLSPDGRSPATATTPEAALLRLLTAEEEAATRLTDQIRRTREQIDAMRGVFLPLHTARAGSATGDIVSGQDVIARVLGDMADLATSEVLSINPGPVLPQEVLAQELRRDLRLLERGVAVRSIHLRPMTRIIHSMAHLQELRDAGAKLRIASIVPFRFTLVDRVQALVPALHTNAADAMMVLRGEAVTALLVKVFEMCWASASPVEPAGAGHEEELSAQQLWVLRLMATGRKDEAIARELGLSVRTLRRVMADLMTRLGVESRFQAGFEAARRGLLG